MKHLMQKEPFRVMHIDQSESVIVGIVRLKTWRTVRN